MTDSATNSKQQIFFRSIGPLGARLRRHLARPASCQRALAPPRSALGQLPFNAIVPHTDESRDGSEMICGDDEPHNERQRAIAWRQRSTNGRTRGKAESDAKAPVRPLATSEEALFETCKSRRSHRPFEVKACPLKSNIWKPENKEFFSRWSIRSTRKPNPLQSSRVSGSNCCRRMICALSEHHGIRA